MRLWGKSEKNDKVRREKMKILAKSETCAELETGMGENDKVISI
jgi:hypothetical protein